MTWIDRMKVIRDSLFRAKELRRLREEFENVMSGAIVEKAGA